MKERPAMESKTLLPPSGVASAAQTALIPKPFWWGDEEKTQKAARLLQRSRALYQQAGIQHPAIMVGLLCSGKVFRRSPVRLQRGATIAVDIGAGLSLDA